MIGRAPVFGIGEEGDVRGRDVLAFAANLMNNRQPIAINYSDLLPFADQLANLNGNAIDIILETPGGSGETVEDIVTHERVAPPAIAAWRRCTPTRGTWSAELQPP